MNNLERLKRLEDIHIELCTLLKDIVEECRDELPKLYLSKEHIKEIGIENMENSPARSFLKVSLDLMISRLALDIKTLEWLEN